MRQILILSIMLLAGCSKGGDTADENSADQPVAEVRVAVATLGSNEGVITAYGGDRVWALELLIR